MSTTDNSANGGPDPKVEFQYVVNQSGDVRLSFSWEIKDVISDRQTRGYRMRVGMGGGPSIESGQLMLHFEDTAGDVERFTFVFVQDFLGRTLRINSVADAAKRGDNGEGFEEP